MGQALSMILNASADTSRVDFAGRTDLAITHDLMRTHGLSTDANAIDSFHQEYLRRLPEALQRSSGAVLPGVVDWLEEIAGRASTAIGLLKQATCSPPLNINFRITNCGIALDSVDLGVHWNSGTKWPGKRFAAARSFVAPSQVSSTWVVGDTPRDIECARAINAQVIAVATGKYEMDELAEYEPDVLLPDLSDLGAVKRILD